MNEEVIEYFMGLYPDRMELDKMDKFTRIKLIGKIELLNEMVRFIDEEYGTKLGKSK